MDGYVDQLGDLKPKHFKKKDMDDIKDIALKELGTHTQNLTELDQERRQVNEKDNESDLLNIYIKLKTKM